MKTTILKDINDNPYIGLKIPTNTDGIFKMLLDWTFDHITNFDRFNKNLLKRNNGSYHITIFNVMNCSKFKNLLHYIDIDIDDIIITGIGCISKNNDNTFFMTVESKTLTDLIQQLDFPPHDFHITIGFTNKDIFGQRKNIPNLKNIYL